MLRVIYSQDIRSNLGDEQDLIPSLRNAVGTMMTGIIMGKRYDRQDPDWLALQAALDNNSKIATLTNPLNYIPLLR